MDAALVYHYFASKEGLFLEAMRSQMAPPTRLELPPEEPPEERARRVVGLFLERWGGAREPTPLVALLRSASTDPRAAALLRQLFARQILSQVAVTLPRQDAELRIALIGSALFGAALFRYILRVEPLASASSDQVGRWLAPMLVRYMAEPL